MTDETASGADAAPEEEPSPVGPPMGTGRPTPAGLPMGMPEERPAEANGTGAPGLQGEGAGSGADESGGSPAVEAPSERGDPIPEGLPEGMAEERETEPPDPVT